MKIYYTDNYNNEKDESRRWLVEAVCRELEAHEADGLTMKEAYDRALLLVDGIHSSTEYGKPVIDDFKDFSISHSDRLWAVAVTECQCGLDVQKVKENANIQLVSGRYYTEAEQAAVRNDGAWRFFWLWARREALVKAVGTTVVNSRLPDALADEVEFEGRKWHLRSFNIPESEDAYCAVCVPEESEDCCLELELEYIG